jgi:hypothetical protein
MEGGHISDDRIVLDGKWFIDLEHRAHKHASHTQLPLARLINDCGPLHVIIDNRFHPSSGPVGIIQSPRTTSGLLVEQSGHVFLLVFPSIRWSYPVLIPLP